MNLHMTDKQSENGQKSLPLEGKVSYGVSRKPDDG